MSLLRLYLHANHPRFVEAYEELEEARRCSPLTRIYGLNTEHLRSY